jgi:hypothetical protein
MIKNDGNIGINDGNPGQLLSVTKAVAGEYITALLNSSSTGSGLLVRGGDTSSHHALSVQDYAGNWKFQVLGDGQVYHRGGNFHIWEDNTRLRIGASEDLELYHNGSNSIINNKTGNLILNQGHSSGNLEFEIQGSGSYVWDSSPATFAGNVTVGGTTQGDKFIIGGYNGRAVTWHSPSNDRQFYFGINTSSQNYISAESPGGGAMYFGVGVTPAQYTLDVAGNIGYSGSITDYSLRELKEDIEEIDGIGMIEKVKKLPLYKYNLKSSSMSLSDDSEVYNKSKGRYGLIADDEINLEEFPELINWGQHEDEDEPRIVGVDTTAYIGILHGAIKELISKVEALENA